MADQTEHEAVHAHVAEKARSGDWGPLESLAWAADRDAVSTFRAALALSRLCADTTARADPIHATLHRGFGLSGCVGPAFLGQVQRTLGFTDVRARYLTEQLDQEARAAAGLTGGD